ncbi:MAG TPA: acyltransferase [Steroidobacteraceae bacterium]|jgi:peptidoglycan/LPS O-acetylase OafA/YrhL|nr:acyltransferase [Steroidobacteraceae bacterium]
MIIPLTSLRGFAAFAVLGFHFSPLLGGIPIFNRGFLGVDLFFLLSGFILAKVYDKRLDVPSYFVARIARTYPLHLFALLLLLPALGRGDAYSVRSLLCNLAMTQVVCGGPMSWNSVSWSLSAEWISYLLFPILLRPVLRCPRWATAILILCCAAILASVSPITADDNYRLPALGRSLPEFLTGMVLYRLYNDKWLAHWGYFAGAVVMAALAFATHAPDILILTAFAAIILSSPYAKLMEYRVFSFMGDISYSLYMFQLLTADVLGAALLATGIRSGLAIAITGMGASILVATVTHRYVEVPARTRVRQWMAPRMVRQGTA